MNETLETILWISGGIVVVSCGTIFIGYSCEKISEGWSFYKHDNYFYKKRIIDKKPSLLRSIVKSYFCKNQ